MARTEGRDSDRSGVVLRLAEGVHEDFAWSGELSTVVYSYECGPPRLLVSRFTTSA